ncbi:MAG: hypothetical protein FJW30_30560 [Acidobacteria bacterium]|nr:hypothetical protein [Acidobacteriota bacterium]
MPEDFDIGLYPALTPHTIEKCYNRIQELKAKTAPANFLEALVANELIHASWELERARNVENTTPYVAQFQNRASRNWRRALKTLKSLQTARAAQSTKLDVRNEQVIAQATPLADPTKMPDRKYDGAIWKWEAEQFHAMGRPEE